MTMLQKIYSTVTSDRLWGPRSILSDGYRGLFSRG